MINEIILDRYIPEEVERVKKIIKGMPKSLYAKVIELFSEGTRNSHTQIEYLMTYETAIATFRAAALEIRKSMDILTLEQRLEAQRSLARDESEPSKSLLVSKAKNENESLSQEITDAIFFSNRYALYFAGNVGLSLLNEQSAEITKSFSFGTKYDASKDRDTQTTGLVTLAVTDLENIAQGKRKKEEKISDDDIKYTLEAIFTTWINQFDWRTFEVIAKVRGVSETLLRFGNYSLKAGNFKRKYDTVEIDEKFMPVSKEEVIGGQEFAEVLWDNLIKLGAYNHDKKKNPYSPANVIFTYGEPGCGKTFTAHAYIRAFSELCKEKGIPLLALTHSTTDYASEYQNKTANELAALANRIREFPGPVVMYVADADNLFHSRKSAHITIEQQQTLSVYFKIFDGQLIPRTGKFLAIMDANYIDKIDDATKSRLFDEIVELKRFDKPEQFAELAKRSLTKGLESHLLSESEWIEVGQYLLNCPLSNREIDHVIKKLRRGFKVPEEMLGRPDEEHEQLRNKQLKSISKNLIVGNFDSYIQTRMQIERASYEAKSREDFERFLSALKEKGRETLAGAQE